MNETQMKYFVSVIKRQIETFILHSRCTSYTVLNRPLQGCNCYMCTNPKHVFFCVILTVKKQPCNAFLFCISEVA